MLHGPPIKTAEKSPKLAPPPKTVLLAPNTIHMPRTMSKTPNRGLHMPVPGSLTPIRSTISHYPANQFAPPIRVSAPRPIMPPVHWSPTIVHLNPVMHPNWHGFY
eukprot:Platyproteum_vivax@DN32_c0_g2_i1.p1